MLENLLTARVLLLKNNVKLKITFHAFLDVSGCSLFQAAVQVKFVDIPPDAELLKDKAKAILGTHDTAKDMSEDKTLPGDIAKDLSALTKDTAGQTEPGSRVSGETPGGKDSSRGSPAAGTDAAKGLSRENEVKS